MSDGGAVPSAQERLERAGRDRHEAAALAARIEAATRHADATTVRVQEARDRLRDEAADVERLTSLSWSRILSTLRGSHATDSEREQAEVDAARYALADAQARDDLAWQEVTHLQDRLDALGDVEQEHAAALAAQEAWVTNHDPATAAGLADVAARRGALLAEDQEAREAFAAGTRAREHLERARSLLASASAWSTWDTFGGGGLLTDLVKYDRLDEVADVLRRADHALDAFSRELADLRLGGVEAVHLDSMTRTFDVFFDNIFTDLRVRSRIQDAGRRVEHALGAVEATLQALHRRGRVIADELETLGRRREELLSGGR
jgi:hypothetical protein